MKNTITFNFTNEAAPVDHRKLLLTLLGLDEKATEQMVNERYTAAMNTEPSPEAKSLTDALAKVKAAGITLTEDAGGVAVAMANQIISCAAKHAEKETKLAANEASLAAVTSERDTVKGELAAAKAELETAKVNLANERKARAVTAADAFIKEGRLTAAEKDAAVANLCNEFDKAHAELAARKPALKTESTVRGKAGSPESQGRVQTVLNMVNEELTANPALGYDAAWAKVKEKNPALFKDMANPASAAK